MTDWCPENDGAYRAEMAAMYPVVNRKLIKELEAKLAKAVDKTVELEDVLVSKRKRILTVESDKIDLAFKLAGVKGKLMDAREEGFWAGRSCGGTKKEIDAALAELKGQDQ